MRGEKQWRQFGGRSPAKEIHFCECKVGWIFRLDRAGNYAFFDFISPWTIAPTTGFRISRVTACKTSGFNFASTLATRSSMLGVGAGVVAGAGVSRISSVA